MSEALAVTADGAVFRGRSVGADGVAVGEAVFNTAMAGYQEIFTDPSYAGQVVVMTSSHIGNYGVASDDDQAARPWARGVIVRSMSSYGYPEHIRINVGLPEENRRFVEALQKVI